MVLDDYDGQILTGDERGLNFLTFLTVEEKPRKNFNQEIGLTGDRTRARRMIGKPSYPSTTAVICFAVQQT